MMAFGFTIAGILIFLGIVLAGAIVGGLWFAISAMRPEYLERHRGPD